MLNIKPLDIKIPDNCMECRFCYDEQYSSLTCLFTGAFVSMNYINRNPLCPLIEIREEE